MKSFQIDWLRIVVWSLLAGVVLACWLGFPRLQRNAMERGYPLLKLERESEERVDRFYAEEKKRMAQAMAIRPGEIKRETNRWHNWSVRAADMTEAEKTDLARRFDEKFLPALQRWGAAYSNRIPFDLSRVTLGKFDNMYGYQFTFEMGDVTLSIDDSKKDTKVSYFTAHEVEHLLNLPLPAGATPDPSMPVTRAEIHQLLKADSGMDYPPDQVQITPTGVLHALKGGVMVEAGGIDGNGVFRAMTNTNLDFVLGADGKLVRYQH